MCIPKIYNIKNNVCALTRLGEKGGEVSVKPKYRLNLSKRGSEFFTLGRSYGGDESL